jgi:hypothetical protein
MTSSQVSYKTEYRDLRTKFIESLVGRPYEKNARGPDAFDCWHFAVFVQYHVFGRNAPKVEVPPNATWKWMIDQFATHQELENWVECLQPVNGLITASDGAMVLMSRNKQPAHCGVWLGLEKAIIHCDDPGGVMFQTASDLRANGWTKLRFYEPR